MSERRSKLPVNGRNQDEAPSLPWSEDAEKSCLGAVLTHNEAWEGISHLGPGSFFRDAHKRIYKALHALIEEQKATADFVTVKDQLARQGDLSEAGGPSYLASLADGVPRALNVRNYASIVKEKATLRAIIETANQISKSAYEASEDASAILSRADRTFLDLQNGHAHSGLVDVRQSYKRLYTDLEDRQAHRGGLRGVTTGFTELDELTLGWRPGWVIMAAARTSMGKSVFGLNTATAAAKQGHTVGYFSYEMKRDELEDRLVASEAQVDHMRLQSGCWNELESVRISHALGIIHDLPIFFNDKRSNTIEDIRRMARRAFSTDGLKALVIDYAQLIPGSVQRKSATRNDELAHIGSSIQELAGELGIPVIVLSQVTRGDGEPDLHDLRDSGTLEEAAHIVGILHRKHHDRDGWTSFRIRKARNGPTGAVWLWMDRACVTLSNPEGHGPTPDEAPKAEPKPKPRSRTFASRYQGAPE